MNGDARNSSVNQALFPNGCHLDPDTRIWCATICSWNGIMKSFTTVCKLPTEPRKYNTPSRVNGKYYFDTGIYHETSSIVRVTKLKSFDSEWTRELNQPPFRVIDACNSDYLHFIQTLLRYLELCLNRGKVYVKPYIRDGKRYNYDKLVLATTISNYCPELMNNRTVNILNNIRTWKCKEWTKTTPQIHNDNETFMNDGIQHNIEDTEQLCYRIVKQTEICRKIYRIKEREERIINDF